jgi:hypothetical protein
MCYKVLYIHGVSCATAVQVHLLSMLHCVTAVACTGYLVQCAPCGLSYGDPQLPALLVAIEYLTMLEGDLWRGMSYYTLFMIIAQAVYVLYEAL